MTADFVHLRMHSQFSLVDGLINLKKVGHKAVAAGMKALASTDLSVMFGSVIFYKSVREFGIKPILGCDVWIENPENREDPHRLLLLCKNEDGYHALCEFLTQAWLKNQWKGRAEINPDLLTVESCSGLIALYGFEGGAVGKYLRNQNYASAKREAERLAKIFPDSFYIELQRAGRSSDNSLVEESLKLAIDTKLPVVATHPIQFYEKEDFDAHEARVCIARSWTLANRNRPRDFTKEQYFKSAEEMRSLFADIPSACENTLEIAKRCNLELKLGDAKLPLFPTPEGLSLDDYMAKLSREGLDRRLEKLYPDEAKRAEVFPKYKERLEMEISTITKMKFPGYFLIVQDFINWGKNNGCPVGPGRGSGAGSLVAYSLGITDLDPLEYDLLFERFLNPERVSMPDFDVDFCQNNRDRVIQYVKDSYGDQAVSQIATFGTMAAKGVLRDCGRILDVPFQEVDRLAKLVPAIPGKNPTLLEVFDSESDFRQLVKEDPTAKRIFNLALKLEGVVKSIGMHAGGVLIAPGKLTDFCPLYSADMKPENVVSMYDKKDVEAVGLVKFDFLGLTTLTIVERALEYIEANTGSKPDIAHVPLDDDKAYEIFKQGDTVAVFQFESPGMQDLLVKAQPSELKDLIALNALYRPGPMDLIPDYLDIKKGEKQAEYADPRIEPVLSETYGIMVYQEQVMRVAQVIGGYSLGGADILRRAMGKKDVKEMDRQRAIFIEGAAKNDVSKETAEHLFDLMQKFAGYGFNKSHAAAYSFVAYQTAWLKAHYPAEFLASNLCEAMNDSEKTWALIQDARQHGITVLGPDVNQSEFYFTAPDSKTIRYGLGAIKGVGQGPGEETAKERKKNGPFKDIYDLTRRVGPHVLNRRVLEAFVQAGAFDSIDPNRNMWMANTNQAITVAQEAAKNAMQVSLFGDEQDAPDEIWIEAVPWSPSTRLLKEKEALGIMFSGHLFDEYRQEVREKLNIAPLSAIEPTQFGETIRIAGILDDFRIQTTKTQRRMGIMALSDGESSIEIALFDDNLEKFRTQLKIDELTFVDISVYKIKDSNNRRINVASVSNLASVRSAHQCKVEVCVRPDANPYEVQDAIIGVQSPKRDLDIPVEIRFDLPGMSASMSLGVNDSIPASAEAIDMVGSIAAIRQVNIIYPCDRDIPN